MKRIKDFLVRTHTDTGLLLLRLLAAFSLAINHGWPAMAGLGDAESNYPDPLGLGPWVTQALMGTAEFVFALFVVVGFLTRFSTIPIIIGFLVAVLVVHGGQPFGQKELAYLYLSAFVVLFFTGPGRYSVDAILFKPKGGKQ